MLKVFNPLLQLVTNLMLLPRLKSVLQLLRLLLFMHICLLL